MNPHRSGDNVVTQALKIDPTGIYDDDLLFGVLGVSGSVLANARREGSLRFVRKGRRVLYLGEWILAWLEAESGKEDRNEHGRGE